MLSAAELERANWGRLFKREVRSAAARGDLYDDAALADAVGVSRNTVQGWWRGARPSPETLRRIAAVTGLSPDALVRFVYFDGPESALASGVQEGIRRDQERQQLGDPAEPPPSPERQPRGTEAGRG